MIREDRFLISRKPYAVDLASFRRSERDPDKSWAWYSIDAVWFRRRRSETVACIGNLRDIIDDPTPTTAEEFLRRFTDGRYGGDCHGRWDGDSYWGTGTLADQEQNLAILRPMLANYPAIPDGYDGWWTFQPQR
ncbi:hypothetical protein ACH4F6_31630 [Streptomyces sp. NPDC017936]|uniref:hypothetical protein n=1 Tax=Streptomyces sp. NPDC017936 TaxID=3365016 RepID=UPI00379ACC36